MFSAIIKPVPRVPEFRWNVPAARYIAENGQFVSFNRMRQALDTNISSITEEMRQVSIKLTERSITLAEWQTEMMTLTKDVNMAGGALERGGWYQLTDTDLAKLENKIAGEFDYLNNFADQIYSGEQPMDGRLVNRAQLYGDQGRVTYHEFAAETATDRGLDEERSRLNPGESCQSCIDEDAKGWQPRGDIKPIGTRTCLSRCNCEMLYRSSVTGEERSV